MVRLALALGLVLACAQAARAEGPAPLDRVQARRSRGLLVVTAAGRAPGAGGPLVARLRLGDRVGLEAPAAVGPDGAVEVELVTTRALLPGRYVVEVGPPEAGAAPLLAGPLAVGTEAEATAAAERLAAWWGAAAGAARDLAAALDRRGRYHAALLAADRDPVQRDRLEAFLEAWVGAVRGVRMDLATVERRLVFPPNPAAAAAQLRLVEALEAQADAWRQALQRAGAPGPATEAVDAAAAALLQALGRPPALEAWRGGGLAAPPPGRPAGTGVGEASVDAPDLGPGARRYTDAGAGVVVPLPAGWTALEADRKPEERLRLSRPDGQASLVVEVQPLPDARTPEALAAAVETLAWEGYLSYKRLASEPLVEGAARVGVRIAFEADVLVEGRLEHVRVVQTSRWPAAGGVVAHALVVRRPDEAAPTDGVDDLVARAFRPVEGP